MGKAMVGQANCGEGPEPTPNQHLRASGCKKGDQRRTNGNLSTGETTIKPWKHLPEDPWLQLIRYIPKKDENGLTDEKDTTATQAAEICQKLVGSGLVGYDQGERNTLIQELRGRNYDVNEFINNKCLDGETDCVAFICTCWACVSETMRKAYEDSRYAVTNKKGKQQTDKYNNPIYNLPVCDNLWKRIDWAQTHGAPQEFKLITEKDFLTTDANLQVGDIMTRWHYSKEKDRNTGHTIMIVSTDGNVLKTEPSVTVGDTLVYDNGSDSSDPYAGRKVKSDVKKGDNKVSNWNNDRKKRGKKRLTVGTHMKQR